MLARFWLGRGHSCTAALLQLPALKLPLDRGPEGRHIKVHRFNGGKPRFMIGSGLQPTALFREGVSPSHYEFLRASAVQEAPRLLRYMYLRNLTPLPSCAILLPWAYSAHRTLFDFAAGCPKLTTGN